MSAALQIVELSQGSQEWLDFRKTKITATDAVVIMGASPWKTRFQLYHEKISDDNQNFCNERMQRGIELEPLARELFTLKTGIHVEPAVIVKDWAMASLDGISACGKHIVEIKCPGDKDHSIAVAGSVPDHYYPQLQHQMYVCGVDSMYYFSFDGFDGVIVKVDREDAYIKKMVAEETIFYDFLVKGQAPEPSEDDYIERNDDIWQEYASQWRSVKDSLKQLEEQEEWLRKNLIALSGESNSKGAGISLCKIERKGNVDYSNIPELKDVNTEQYRKAPIKTWRIVCQ